MNQEQEFLISFDKFDPRAQNPSLLIDQHSEPICKLDYATNNYSMFSIWRPDWLLGTTFDLFLAGRGGVPVITRES